jgi:uncharacterized membrane protein
MNWNVLRKNHNQQVVPIEESATARVATALLLGLDLLVAADVVRTVALEATLRNVAVLGLLILIRTFLSWSLTVEMEGRLPWQSRPATNPRSSTEQSELSLRSRR